MILCRLSLALPVSVTGVNKGQEKCPKGHVTHSFLSCDLMSDCWAENHVSCDAPLTPLPPMFECSKGADRVPYTLVCDHRPDCSDGEDEHFCVFPPCPQWTCDNRQVNLTVYFNARRKFRPPCLTITLTSICCFWPAYIRHSTNWNRSSTGTLIYIGKNWDLTYKWSFQDISF